MKVDIKSKMRSRLYPEGPSDAPPIGFTPLDKPRGIDDPSDARDVQRAIEYHQSKAIQSQSETKRVLENIDNQISQAKAKITQVQIHNDKRTLKVYARAQPAKDDKAKEN